MSRAAYLSCVLISGALIACGDDLDPPKLSFAISAVGSGGGTVTSEPAGIDCGATCAYEFAPGTRLTLTATPHAGSSFAGWTGSCTGKDTCTIVVGSTGSVTAKFAMDNELAVTVTGVGRVTSSPGGIDCTDACSKIYTSGTQVTLTATPDASTTFAGWSGACTGTGACVVSLDRARSVTAAFEIKHHELAVVRSGNGAGTVTGTGIACGTDCDETFDHGTQVTLTAAADVGSTFAGWSGACSTNSLVIPTTCTVSVEDAMTVTAAFSLNTYGMTVVKHGNGAGSVAAAGIDCGLDCGESYDFGTVVTLTATPVTGSTFDGWSAPCSGTGTCVVTISDATTVVATFTLTQHVLTVARDGNGTGTVTASGINCGTDCDETFDYGTQVTLTAAPAVNATFEGWTGGNCSGTGTCVVDVTAATTVTATFALVKHALRVTKTGAGTGTVTSSPAGINCGTTCEDVYDDGTIVTLTAEPTSGQAFIGWSGACSGTGTCAVTMTEARNVAAEFSACPSGSQTLIYTGTQQTFTVPACVTSITIDAYGAEGGTSTGESGGQSFTGGLGARARGTFAVTGGETLDILVGGRGGDSNCGSGGGGGSFAMRSGTLLLAAGGGGGGFHCEVLGGANGVGGNTSTSGGDGVCGVSPYGYPRSPTPGGTNGSGATCGFGGGGGGFLSDGSSEYWAPAAGRVFGPTASPGGGFGGGGGYYEHGCCGSAGGGGGYSGGGASVDDGCAGGGGGSYNGGTVQLMTAATRAGNGLVIISY